ncbi:glutathione S-transferase, partial [Hygrophoropsis aurantiaca]
MTVTKITFFDIPTLLPVSTSPNTWKVRLALNYKGLPFETRWVETCDIEKVCKSLGIPPTSVSPSGTPKYTLPALIDHTFSPPSILSDSTPIIEYLERTYPDPDPSRALCPPNSRSLEALFEYYINSSITAHIIPLMVMHMYDKKTPRDRVHFRERMEAAFGKRLEDIELQGREREEAWKRIEVVFDLLSFFMQQNGGGDFFTGEKLSLADCTLGGLMIALRYDSPDEAWGKVMSWSNRRWARYMSALEKWVFV